MAAKQLRFFEVALAEYLDAVEWYLDQSEAADSGFTKAVARAAATLAEAPNRWPVYLHGARRMLLDRFPYALVYRELPEVIQILAVAHCSRRPGYWKDRR